MRFSHPLPVITASRSFSAARWRPPVEGVGLAGTLEKRPLLFEHQLRPWNRWGGHQGDRGNLLFLLADEQRNPAALAVADEGDSRGIDVAPFRVKSRRHRVGGELLQRRRFLTAATLPGAPFVVPDDENPASAIAFASCAKIGMPATNSSRSLGADPDTSTTAGKRTGAGFLPAQAALSRADGSDIVAARLKPFAGIRDVLVVRSRHGHQTGRDAGNIVAHDAEHLGGNVHPTATGSFGWTFPRRC